MSNSEASNSSLSKPLDNIYRFADKSSWYSKVAEAYDRTRPRYPNKIMARVQEIARLQPGKLILEIGAGPGIASIDLAKLGLQMICLEPSLAACQLAQQKCSAYPHVKFVNSTFEEWHAQGRKFDAVLTTTSFHWLEPGIRTEKTAKILKDNGWLILLWNTSPHPSYEVHQALYDVYQAYAPNLSQYKDAQSHYKSLTKMGQEVVDSGYFQDLISEQIIVEVNYTVDDYISLLTTLSPYIRLETEQRTKLLVELKKILKLNFGNQLDLAYLSMFQAAKKRQTNNTNFKLF